MEQTVHHGRWKCLKVGGARSGRDHGERVEREPITGVWGRSPQRGPGAEPLVGGQGGEAPLKLKVFWFLNVPRAEKLIPLSVFSKVFNRDMVQVYSQNLVSMVRIGCAVRK